MFRLCVRKTWFRSAERKVSIHTRFLSNDALSRKLPSQAEIIIAGGGAIGTSVAYHLSELGWKDILVLEQGSVGCGTSWHAAGLVGTVRATEAETQNCVYALDLYSKFEQKYGIGFKQCGSLLLAQTDDRALKLDKVEVKARQYGLDCRHVNVAEALKIHPFIRTDDIQVGLYLPNDAVVNPTDLIQAYIKEATKEGSTKLVEGVKVTCVETDKHRVTSVETNLGKIDCSIFINCGGLWAREIGLLSNPPVEVPLHASEHFYIVTKPIENVHSMLPVVRDYDARTYVREWSGGFMCGGFETKGKPCFYENVPENFEFQLLEEDWPQFGELMDGLLHRYPCLEKAEIRQFVNGPESFTPDSQQLVCKSVEFDNYYFAAGMSSFGIASSAGIGRTLSELITFGESSVDSSMFDVRRMPKGSMNKFYLRDRTPWSLRVHYELAYPRMNFDSCRLVMNSPIHGLLDQLGVVWGQDGNWEVPYYFTEIHAKHKHTFGKPHWLSAVQSELRSCEEGIGLVDLSSRSKFKIVCADEDEMQHFLKSLCLGDVDKMARGDVIDTAVLNGKKECQSLVSLVKVNQNKNMIIAPAEQHTRLFTSLHASIRHNDYNITVEDESGKYATLGLLGPYTEDLLNELLAPPYKTHQIQGGCFMTVDIGYASKVKLARHFMNGVPGWKIYVPTEFSQGLYQLLISHGEKYGIKNIGHYSVDCIRVKNMIPQYGAEVATDTNFEFVDKLIRNEKHERGNQTLILLEIIVPSSENWPYGGEPVILGDHLVGNLTSVGYTQDENKLLGLVVSSEDLEDGQEVSVQCGLDVYHATVVSRR